MPASSTITAACASSSEPACPGLRCVTLPTWTCARMHCTEGSCRRQRTGSSAAAPCYAQARAGLCCGRQPVPAWQASRTEADDLSG